MDEHTKKAFTDLTQIPKGAKPVYHKPDPAYDFEHLGSTLADSLTAAADELVDNARRLADDFQKLASEIRSQVAEQSKSLADINERMKAAGDQVLEAHRKFTGI